MGLLPFSSPPTSKRNAYSPADFVVAPSSSGVKADYYTDGTNDDVEIQAAVDAAAALSNGGSVYLKSGTYNINTPVVPKSNVILRGDGASTILLQVNTWPVNQSTKVSMIKSSTGAFSNFTVERIFFNGPNTNAPSTPTRARSASSTGANVAIDIEGSLDANAPTNPVISKIVIRNCIFRNMSWLPIFIDGVTDVKVHDNEFTNNMDVGFIYNSGVSFTGNLVRGSSDNGVSISRGNSDIVCVGNKFNNCAFNGIWLSGFSGELGPSDFTCTGNSIVNVGESGIIVQDSSNVSGVISSNMIDKGSFRGPSDSGQDTSCCGIYLSGSPSVATGLSITGNYVKGGARAGIFLNACSGVNVSGNTIVDTGTQFLADGTTAILSSDATQNIGILLFSASAVKTYIFNNLIIDTRGTPYTNFGVAPTSQSQVVTFNNRMINCRNADNTLATIAGVTLAIGANDATNPVLNLDASAASVATGLNIAGAAAASGLAVSTLSSGTNENMTLDAKGTGTIIINGTSTTSGRVTLGNATSKAGAAVQGLLLITAANANGIVMGPNGSTNPTFQVDSSTASAATGVQIKSAAAAAGAAIKTLSSGTNEALTIDAKGSGALTLGGTSTGLVSIGRGAVKPPTLSTTTTALGTVQNSTPTAAQIRGGVLTQTSATGAGTVTLDTGTNISTQVTGVATGDTFECLFANLGGGFTLTITGATGATVVGNAAIPSGKNAVLTFVNTGANAWNVYCQVSA